MEVVTTSINKLWLDERGIGHIVFLPGVRVTVSGLREQFELATRQSHGQAVPVLADIRQLGPVDREARQLMTTEAAALTKAAAVLVNSPVGRVFGTLFIAINRPPYPIKIFTSEAAATAWLEKFVDPSLAGSRADQAPAG